MAKLSRSYLKSIVKECLVEILEEGIGVPQGGVISERRSRKTAKASRKSESQSRRKAYDNISYGSSKKVKNPNFNENIDRSVKSLSSDPVLQAIFSDTAKTTLQEQISDPGAGQVSAAEVQISSQGDAAAKAMIQSDPMNIFGDASMNWEALAFPDNQSKN